MLIAKRIERGGFMQLSELMARSEITIPELKQIFHGSHLRMPIVDRSQKPLTQRESVALPEGIVNAYI